MRRILPFLLVPVIACGNPNVTPPDAGGDAPDAGPGPVEPAEFCPGPTTLVYDPLSKQLAAFPDDFWTDDDAATATGVKVHMKADNLTVPVALGRFKSAFDDVSTLDGFGTNASLVVRFSGPLRADTIPSGLETAEAGSPIVLVNLSAATPTFVPFETLAVTESASDESVTLVLTPMFPLAPATRYGFAVTQDLVDAAGTCLAPSDTMKSLLDGTATDPKLTRLASRYTDLVTKLTTAGVIGGPKSLAAGFVFTTQTTTDDDVAISADIRTRAFTWTAGACTAGPLFTQCEGSFSAGNYRTGTYLADGTTAPKSQYTVPVTAWLPNATQTGPWKTMIYGHGLGGDRLQARFLAETAVPAGYAVVALDAPKHGTHPDVPDPQFVQAAQLLGIPASQAGVFDFLGVRLAGFSVALDARKLRDHLRAAAYDKLQLVELLRAGLDVNDDDRPDLDVSNLTYVGVSLGGIMAPEFLANTADVKVAVPIVPGARMTEILRDSENFQQAIDQFRGNATDGDLARIFAVIQVALDRGDPGSYLPHLLSNRLVGTDADAPQLLVQMAIGDTIVPNSSTRYYARGAGIALVGEALQPLPGVPHLTDFDVSGNIRAGLTAGLYQYDLVLTDSAGSTAPAEHNTLPGNPVSWVQLDAFVNGYYLQSNARIIDSYRELDIKP